MAYRLNAFIGEWVAQPLAARNWQRDRFVFAWASRRGDQAVLDFQNHPTGLPGITEFYLNTCVVPDPWREYELSDLEPGEKAPGIELVGVDRVERVKPPREASDDSLGKYRFASDVWRFDALDRESVVRCGAAVTKALETVAPRLEELISNREAILLKYARNPNLYRDLSALFRVDQGEQIPEDEIATLSDDKLQQFLRVKLDTNR